MRQRPTKNLTTAVFAQQRAMLARINSRELQRPTLCLLDRTLLRILGEQLTRGEGLTANQAKRLHELHSGTPPGRVTG